VALPSCETGSSVKAPKGRGLDRTFHCGRTFAVSRLTNIRELITYPESVDQTRASLAELAEEQGITQTSHLPGKSRDHDLDAQDHGLTESDFILAAKTDQLYKR